MWTNEMNKTVVHSYYKSTKLETELSNYKSVMLELFNSKFPRFIDRMTEAKLMERKRYLFKYNKISQIEINIIKDTVERELHNNLSSTDELETSTINMNISSELSFNSSIRNIIESQQELFNSSEEEELFRELTQTINFALISFMNTEPEARIALPKLRYSKKLDQIIQMLNDHILPGLLSECECLEYLQSIVYCTAYATAATLGLKMNDISSRERTETNTKYPWMIRLEKRIAKTRAKLGRLTQFKNGVRSCKLINKINKEIHPLHIEHLDQNELTEILHSTTQRLRILANRLKRYTERVQRRTQNDMFEHNQKKFYRSLKTKPNVNSVEQSNIEEISEYWKTIWSNRVSYNKHATWMTEETHRTNDIPQMNNTVITEDDIKDAIKKTNNWRAPGIDGIHNYWYKKLTCIYSKMATFFNLILTNPSEVPIFMTHGVTYLIKKDININNASNFRPITCLPTIYKLCTSIIANKIYEHCESNSIITKEQKGCSTKSKGCKDQITIDSIIVQQAVHKQRNLSMGYIDYKKAFDSMSHEYLMDVLKVYKISNNIIKFFEHVSTLWNTTLCIANDLRNIRSQKIKISRGIFQGDAFSPLWFCLAMNPLSNILKTTNYGYDVKSNIGTQKFNHLFFMDDLKIYANSQEQLCKMISITERFSADINMKFNIDKTKIVHLIRGNLISTSGYVTEDANIIKDIAKDESYKYLGFAQLRGILHSDIKKTIKKQFKKRVNDVLKTLLNSKNKTKAINQYAVPYLIYSFGIIKWSNTDLDDIERDLRKCLKYNRMHDPKAAVERICLPRKMGGRGFLDLKKIYCEQHEALRSYFLNAAHNNEAYNIICAADDGYSVLHLKNPEYIHTVKFDTIDDRINSWKNKLLHGEFPKQIFMPHIDMELSNKWLVNGELFGETEGFVLSIQDRTVKTRNYRKYILHQQIENDKCRLCGRINENIDHILNGCTVLASSEYLERHNRVAKIIHQNFALRCNFITEKQPYYKYIPISFLENAEYLLTWDKCIQTDKQVQANKPDIIFWNKQKKELFIIDVTIPLNSTIQSAFGEKIRKYTELQYELKELWRVEEALIIPVIVSSTGLIPLSLKDSLKKIEMEYEIGDMQKAVLLATCNIVRKFLNQ